MMNLKIERFNGKISLTLAGCIVQLTPDEAELLSYALEKIANRTSDTSVELDVPLLAASE